MTARTTGSGGVSVTSEIGPLEAVLCHTPGPELGVVTPDTLRFYLFNDLLDLEIARREHGRFWTILERFAGVYEISDLLREVVEQPDARAFMLRESRNDWGDRVDGMPPEHLVQLFVEGEESSGGGSLAELMNETGYVLPPLPNLFFCRDPAAVLGDHVVVASMQHDVRWTEELIARTLFTFHPLLANEGLLYDGTVERRMNTSLEGGDIHVLRRDLVLVGMSERTSAAGIDALREALFATTEVRDLLVVVLPSHRTSIHLDMVFTMADRELCCIYAPYFIGPGRLPVLHVSRGNDGIREMPNLFTALSRLELPLEPIFCGGERRVTQQREQWASGCNLFALGPGQLMAYDRNEHTLSALESEGGFRIVRGVDFLTGDEDVDEEGRFVITFEGSELVRGGGGPRCMTLPVRRQDPW